MSRKSKARKVTPIATLVPPGEEITQVDPAPAPAQPEPHVDPNPTTEVPALVPDPTPEEGEEPPAVEDSDANNPATSQPSKGQVEKTLRAFGSIYQQIDLKNYEAAALGNRFTLEYLACEPGKARRDVAIARLADVAGQHDDAAFLMSPSDAINYMRNKINALLQTGAACRILGDGRGVEKGDGTGSGRGRRGGKDRPLPWSIMTEFRPLVRRIDDPYKEEWLPIASVADDARALVVKVAQSGLARADVVVEVAKLLLFDAQLEHETATKAGDEKRVKSSAVLVERWARKAGLPNPLKPADPEPQPAPVPAPAPEPIPAPASSDNQPAHQSNQDAAPVAPPANQGDQPAPTPEPTPGPSIVPPTPPAPTSANSEAPDCRATHMLRTSPDASPSDAAEMALGFIMENVAPDDVVIDLVRRVALSAEFSTPVRDALAAAFHAIQDRFQAPPVPADQSAETLIEEHKELVEDAIIDALTNPAPAPVEAPASPEVAEVVEAPTPAPSKGKGKRRKSKAAA